MNPPSFVFFTALGLLLGAACAPLSDGPTEVSQATDSASDATHVLNVHADPRLAPIRAAFEQALQAQPGPDGKYPTVTVTPERNVIAPPGALGIALVDYGAYVGSMGVYRHRVVRHYEPVGTEYTPVTPSLSLPAPAKTILVDTFQRGDEFLASSRDLEDLGAAFHAKFGRRGLVSGGEILGHGQWIFNPLAELNPDAYFLIFHEDANTHNAAAHLGSAVCGIRSPGGASAARAFFRTRGESIAHVVRAERGMGLDVRLVNLSQGMDDFTLQRLADETCPPLHLNSEELETLQRAYIEFVEAIAAANVIVVEAAVDPAISDAEVTEENWQTRYSDCKAIANRVRVGYAVGTPGDGIDRRVPPEERPSRRCIDMLVGFGWATGDDSTPRAFRVSALGVGHGILDFISTSLATPLGLSVIAEAWSHHQGATPTQIASMFQHRPDENPRVYDVLEEHLYLNSDPTYVNRL